MRNDRGRELVDETARFAQDAGLAADPEFNVVEHERVTIHGLYGWLALAVSRVTTAASRGERRTARKVRHAIQNALIDLRESAAAVSAESNGVWGNNPLPEGFMPDGGWDSLALWAQGRMWEMALNGSVLSTQRRAVRDVRALGRLLRRLQSRGITAPIARPRARDARPGRTPDRDGSGESRDSVSIDLEKGGGAMEGERSEPQKDRARRLGLSGSDPGVSSPDPTRPRTRRDRATGPGERPMGDADGEDGFDEH